MPTDEVRGLGDYEAVRDHGDARREFEEAGEVQKPPAEDAAPTQPAEPDEVELAEQKGLAHAKAELPGTAGPTRIAQPSRGN